MSKKNHTRVYDIRKTLPKPGTPPMIVSPAASNPVLLTPTDAELEKPLNRPAEADPTNEDESKARAESLGIEGHYRRESPQKSRPLIPVVTVDGNTIRVNPLQVCSLQKVTLFGSSATLSRVTLADGTFINIPGTLDDVEAQLFG